MQTPPSAPAYPRMQELFIERMFAAKAVNKAGVIRRSVKDVDREVGRAYLMAEVTRRGFHLIECGGQYIVLCNSGKLNVLC